MNSRIIFSGLIFLLFFLSSCKKTLFNFNFLDKETVAVNNLDFEFLEMKTRIQFHNGDKIQKATAHVRIKKDSVIWMSITPFGIEAARALFTRDSMIFMDKINKNYFVQDYKKLGKKLNVDLDFALLQGLLIGNVPFSDKIRKRKIVRHDESFEIKQSFSKLNIISTINPSSLKAEKIVIKEKSKGSTLSADYSDFRFIDKKRKKKRTTYFPFSNAIDIIYYNKGQVGSTRIVMNASRVQLADKLRFPFKISRKYERIEK